MSADPEEVAGALRSMVRGEVSIRSPLAPFTSMRLGGDAAVLLEAAVEADLPAAARTAQDFEMPVLALGRGSNILVSDGGFPGIVVRLGKGFEWIRDTEGGLEAGGATALPRLANRAASRGLRGLEFAVAIPASLGGAVRMNAGAHQSSMSEVLESVRVYRLGEADVTTIGVSDLGMAYRCSTRLDAIDIVCSARLCLPAGRPEEIAQRMQQYRDHRAATQPPEPRNAGSMFQNPPGTSAGRLIEEAGLKGLRIGGAEVSVKHANFFLARPGATSQDVYRLLVAVQTAVLERHGVLMLPEVRLIGAFGEPELLPAGGTAP